MCAVFNLAAELAVADAASSALQTAGMRRHVFCGARSRFLDVNTCDMVTTLGIQFKPGGAFPFLHLPASELNEQCVSLEDMFGREAGRLREELLACADPEVKFAKVEAWLRSRMRSAEPHPAVEYAIRSFLDGPPRRLSALLPAVNYSQRHFNSLFTSRVGLTPKLFLRVRRFQRAITAIGSAGDVDWPELALECGYYDQAHFANDFRSFSGLTPGAYFASRTPHLNHVPVRD